MVYHKNPSMKEKASEGFDLKELKPLHTLAQWRGFVVKMGKLALRNKWYEKEAS